MRGGRIKSLTGAARTLSSGAMTKNDEKQPVEEAGTTETAASAADPASQPAVPKAPLPPKEIGGPTGPEPTRYGDWERNGRVSDF